MIADQKVVKLFLIIEDDVEISDVVAVNLESNGIKIEHVHDGL
jgi:DNA-binding response OmpR family regulator